MKKLLLTLILALSSLNLSALDKEFDCLTKSVYYEARAEPHSGKLAVALVVLNRVDDKRYPKSVCGVVYQKNQFSWTKNFKRTKVNQVQWEQSKAAALEAYMNRQILGNFRATHFHNKTVNPRWKLTKVTQIAGHTFYR